MRVYFISWAAGKRFLIILMIVFLVATVILRKVSRETLNGIRELTVVIDPGHGGVDGGTKDQYGNLEKDINLDICLRLRKLLRQSGLNVVLTRDCDTDLAPYFPGRYGRHKRDLMARIRKARESGSRFLVSIHCDWSRNSLKRGSWVFYNRHSEESKTFGEIVQNELNRFHLNHKSKASPGNFLIIQQQNTMGILVEAGFLSNPEEALKLQNAVYREGVAASIARGILTHCRNYIK